MGADVHRNSFVHREAYRFSLVFEWYSFLLYDYSYITDIYYLELPDGVSLNGVAEL
jgi:hypothetical protein